MIKITILIFMVRKELYIFPTFLRWGNTTPFNDKEKLLFMEEFKEKGTDRK